MDGREIARVLLIEDTPDDMALLIEHLRGAGLRLAVAADGRHGFDKARAFRPDIVLMGMKQPRPDGLAALRLLKSDIGTADIPVIFLSASHELSDRLALLSQGAVDFVPKPFAPQEVLARLLVHLDIVRRLRSGSTLAALREQRDVEASVQAENRHAVVVAAMNVMRSDLAQVPSLPELARVVGSNERRLTELFREETGLPVFSWLREERFRAACRWLRETDLDIGQVALHVGYGSGSNFATWFRERAGMTPREYRLSGRAGAA